eukprot:COSAG01_NODE_75986_length_191_cov_26.228261_1_plen_58_part_01
MTEGITLPGCVSPRALTPNQGTSSYRRTAALAGLVGLQGLLAEAWLGSRAHNSCRSTA